MNKLTFDFQRHLISFRKLQIAIMTESKNWWDKWQPKLKVEPIHYSDCTYTDLQEISNEILSIQRSLSEYNGMLLQPSRVFIKKGTLQKMSRKNLTQRMFFLVSVHADDPLPTTTSLIGTGSLHLDASQPRWLYRLHAFGSRGKGAIYYWDTNSLSHHLS